MLTLRAIKLINEYSKPLTRPDWRTCNCLISIEEYIFDIQYKYYNNNTKLITLIFNNMVDSDLYKAYNHIYYHGVNSYILKYDLNKHYVLSNKLLNHQNELHHKLFL
jgi:hypothetical protein